VGRGRDPLRREEEIRPQRSGPRPTKSTPVCVGLRDLAGHTKPTHTGVGFQRDISNPRQCAWVWWVRPATKKRETRDPTGIHIVVFVAVSIGSSLVVGGRGLDEKDAQCGRVAEPNLMGLITL